MVTAGQKYTMCSEHNFGWQGCLSKGLQSTDAAGSASPLTFWSFLIALERSASDLSSWTITFRRDLLASAAGAACRCCARFNKQDVEVADCSRGHQSLHDDHILGFENRLRICFIGVGSAKI